MFQLPIFASSNYECSCYAQAVLLSESQSSQLLEASGEMVT